MFFSSNSSIKFTFLTKNFEEPFFLCVYIWNCLHKKHDDF